MECHPYHGPELLQKVRKPGRTRASSGIRGPIGFLRQLDQQVKIWQLVTTLPLMPTKPGMMKCTTVFDSQDAKGIMAAEARMEKRLGTSQP